jgi:cyclase
MRNDRGTWDVYVKGGRENTKKDAIQWALTGQNLGAGEICINSMDADGVKNGFDIELLKTLNKVLSIPVIASGGAGSMEHFTEAFLVGKADAALAASVFHYSEIEIQALKEYLQKRNISMRL